MSQTAGKDSSDQMPNKSKKGSSEQQFTILPHPAKTNNPKDLEPPQPGAGLNNKPEFAALHAHGPQIPNQDILNSLDKPASREELRKRAEELNK